MLASTESWIHPFREFNKNSLKAKTALVGFFGGSKHHNSATCKILLKYPYSDKFRQSTLYRIARVAYTNIINAINIYL